jgi:peptide/nickel transport system permease protein
MCLAFVVGLAVAAAFAVLRRSRRRGIAVGSFAAAAAILGELLLAAVGTGFQPPAPSWGNMLDNGLNNALERPALALWPLLAAGLATFGFALVGASSLATGRDPR